MSKRAAFLTLAVVLAIGFLLVGASPERKALAQNEVTPTSVATTPHIWFHEDFSTRANRWRLFDLGDKSRIAYEEPAQEPGLDLIAQVPDYAFWTFPDSDLKPDHFDMTVTLTSLEGGDDSRVGIILNYRAENDMFVLAVTPKGVLSFGRFYFGVWTDLMQPVQTTIDATQPIILNAVLTTDRNLTLTINGQPGGTAQIEDFRPAGFGLFGLTGQNGGIKAIFRSMVVSDL